MEQIEQLLAYPVHFLVSFIVLILLGFLIKVILDSISSGIDIEPPAGIEESAWRKLVRIPGRGTGSWVGLTDRLIFFVTLWAGAPIIVAAWLTFKVATKWESWSNVAQVPDDLKGAKDPIAYLTARTRWSSRTMQRFLVGTGLNLVAAFLALGIYFGLIALQP